MRGDFIFTYRETQQDEVLADLEADRYNLDLMKIDSILAYQELSVEKRKVALLLIPFKMSKDQLIAIL